MVTNDEFRFGFGSELFFELRGRRFWRCAPRLHARMFYADVHGRSIAYRADASGWEARR